MDNTKKSMMTTLRPTSLSMARPLGGFTLTRHHVERHLDVVKELSTTNVAFGLLAEHLVVFAPMRTHDRMRLRLLCEPFAARFKCKLRLIGIKLRS